jgi:hypothetical protein
MARLINRDPFAREELYKEYIQHDTSKGGCDNCDGTDKNGRIYRFYSEPDGLLNRKNYLKGQFCSVGCMKEYHEC